MKVRSNIYLGKLEQNDQEALVQHLKDREIHKNTLRIPFPYTASDADFWINLKLAEYQNDSMPMSFAIRDQDDFLIGCIGLEKDHQSHQAEIGYWLAKSYRGQGIVTDAVKCLCDYAFDELQLVRITAHVFLFNRASARVLEKCDFQLEGRLRKSHFKEGKFFDSLLYALVR